MGAPSFSDGARHRNARLDIFGWKIGDAASSGGIGHASDVGRSGEHSRYAMDRPNHVAADLEDVSRTAIFSFGPPPSVPVARVAVHDRSPIVMLTDFDPRPVECLKLMLAGVVDTSRDEWPVSLDDAHGPALGHRNLDFVGGGHGGGGLSAARVPRSGSSLDGPDRDART
jgi:hypothetical protein